MVLHKIALRLFDTPHQYGESLTILQPTNSHVAIRTPIENQNKVATCGWGGGAIVGGVGNPRVGGVQPAGGRVGGWAIRNRVGKVQKMIISHRFSYKYSL